MSQFEPTGEQIAREVDLERYGGDPEKARMKADIATLVQMGADQANEIIRLRAALEAIRQVAAEFPQIGHVTSVMGYVTALAAKIEALARQGLAP